MVRTVARGLYVFCVAVMISENAVAGWDGDTFYPDYLEIPGGTSIWSLEENAIACGLIYNECGITGIGVTKLDKTDMSTLKTKWSTTIKDIGMGKSITFSDTGQLLSYSEAPIEEPLANEITVVKNGEYTISGPELEEYVRSFINPKRIFWEKDKRHGCYLDSDWHLDAGLVQPRTPFSELKGISFATKSFGTFKDGSSFYAKVSIGAKGAVTVSGTLPSGKSGKGETYVTCWCPEELPGSYINEDGSICSWGYSPASALIPVIMFDATTTECVGFDLVIEKVNGKWVGCGSKEGAYWTRRGMSSEESGVQVLTFYNGESGFAPSEWKKARTLNGVWGEGCGNGIEGIAQLKCGKANKKGIAKVSLTITPFVGKKRTYKAVSVDVSMGGTIDVRWVKEKYVVSIDGKAFSGEPIYGERRPACSPNSVWSANVGGAQNKTAYFDYGDIPEMQVTANDMIVDNILTDNWIEEYERDEYWDGVPVFAPVGITMNGGKWKCPKASIVKWKKCPKNAMCIGNWMADSKKGMANITGLKLSYKSNMGAFKGSFKMYTFMGKKLTVKVTGVVVDGSGVGLALCPKLSPAKWNVVVK